MGTTITARGLSVYGSTFALSQTGKVVEEETRRAVAPELKHVWYEAPMLAISLIFLLLGLLPFKKNSPAALTRRHHP
jgi:hypothetical protein